MKIDVLYILSLDGQNGSIFTLLSAYWNGGIKMVPGDYSAELEHLAGQKLTGIMTLHGQTLDQ